MNWWSKTIKNIYLRLSDHQSGANLIKKYFDGSETCHETEQEEVNDINELEKKRQIRRRKYESIFWLIQFLNS